MGRGVEVILQIKTVAGSHRHIPTTAYAWFLCPLHPLSLHRFPPKSFTRGSSLPPFQARGVPPLHQDMLRLPWTIPSQGRQHPSCPLHLWERGISAAIHQPGSETQAQAGQESCCPGSSGALATGVSGAAMALQAGAHLVSQGGRAKDAWKLFLGAKGLAHLKFCPERVSTWSCFWECRATWPSHITGLWD